MNGHGRPQYQYMSLLREYTVVKVRVITLVLHWSYEMLKSHSDTAGQLLQVDFKCHYLQHISCHYKVSSIPEYSGRRRQLHIQQYHH